MKISSQMYLRAVMEGAERALPAKLLRSAAACAEPGYAAAMSLRNALYDRGLLSSRWLGRPTISVGNITSGGTGKTPMVLWLARRLAAAGEQPAILLRGYRSDSQGFSDEQAALREALNAASAAPLPVVANPDRVAGATEALRLNPQTSVFILDDGMQHRRVRRDFELVLIHAREPFGFDRVLPRGLLREPLKGLARANAVVLTHAGETEEGERKRTIALLREHTAAPVFLADHAIDGFKDANGESHPVPILVGQRYFAFCGIGSPESFFTQLRRLSDSYAGSRAHGDHYDYRESDLAGMIALAQNAGAEVLVTTEKDWVKLARFAGTVATMPIFRAELSLRFWDDNEARLFELIRHAVAAADKTR